MQAKNMAGNMAYPSLDTVRSMWHLKGRGNGRGELQGYESRVPELQ
jgi:hypothetical protein